MDFLARHVSRNTYLNLMEQYHPSHQAHHHPPLDRRPTAEEFAQARMWAERSGLRRLDTG